MKRIRITKKLTALILLSCFWLLPGNCSGDVQLFQDVYAESPLKNRFRGTAVYELQEAFHAIFELYKDSVVYISTETTVRAQSHPFRNDPFFRKFFGPNQNQQQRTQRQSGLGTGFIISKDGYIATNHHVVAGVDKVTVTVNKKEYTAEIVGADSVTDIALLKIKGNNNFKPVHFGNSDSVQVGDWAIAIGNPFGLDRTFTVGVISAVSRDEVDQLGNSHIQTDASINPGNSGGPLLNLDGEVVGVNRMIYSQSGGSLGIGFAISINVAQKVLEDLKKYKKVRRGYIGVQIAPLTDEFAKELGLKSKAGALIGKTLPDGPAFKAGLREQDIILEAGGQQVNNYRDLVDVVSKTPVGKAIKIVVWRNKSKSNFWMTVTERP